MSHTGLAIMGGCGSSGTTLFTHLLSRHPAVGSGPEFNCFNHHELFDFELFRESYREMFAGKCRPSGYVDVYVFMTFRDHYGIDLELVRGWVDSSRSTSDFVGRLADHLNRRFRSSCLVEKSPTNVYSFKQLSEGLPEVPLIHLVRDGRDVVCSLMKRGFNLFGAGSRWLYDTLAGLRCRGAGNYLELRYEDLVDDPAAVMESAFRHIGLEFDPDLLDKWDSKAPGVYVEDWKERKEPQVWTSTPADPVSKSSVGRYRKQLGSADLDYLERIELTGYGAAQLGVERATFGELLDHLGYRSADGSSPGEGGPRDQGGYAMHQVQDWFRRFKRLSHSRVQRLPRRYTRVAGGRS